MKWNRDEVSGLLNARVVDEPIVDGGHVTIAYFEDALMRYELWISESGVYLSSDPERPVQVLPFFEISIPCTEIAPFRGVGMPTRLGMYCGPIGPATLCFSIIRRDDGLISLSGSWPGMGALRHAKPASDDIVT